MLRNDGLIGRNLLVELKATIDYGERHLQVGRNKIQLVTPEMKILPNSEQKIEVYVDRNGEGLIEDQEIESGVFIINTLVKTERNRAMVMCINTTNKEIVSPKILCKLQQCMYTSIQPQEAKVENFLKLDTLDKNKKLMIQELCNDYRKIFYLPGDKLTTTNTIKHEIPLQENTPPINVKPYRLPEAQKAEINKQINEMLANGTVRESTSPYNAPLLVIPKKMDNSGIQKFRIAVDFRKLNDASIGQHFPLPNITDIIDRLGNSKYFSTLDLASGFHQIELKEEDKPKTAFSTDSHHFEFSRMPFGLKNAPSTFSLLMSTVLSGLIGKICFVYLDDIVIFSSTVSEHIERLKQVFDRLKQHNLLLQPDKCNFLQEEIQYLGHVINREGVKPDPAKVECVQKFPQPKNAKDIKSFLGLAGYYRRFIPQFAKIAKPLNSLLKKDEIFEWKTPQNEAFTKIKEIITSEPILQFPDFSKEFILTTDASMIALGAVLSQGEIGKDKPIAFASRTLNKSEKNYSTTDREILACVWATAHFRPYLYGRKFTILTDHRPLKWLFNVKDPGSRLIRWRLKLEEYEYNIEYKPGSQNVVADALSRVEIKTTNQLARQDENPSNEIESKTEIEEQPIASSNTSESQPSDEDVYIDKHGNRRQWIKDPNTQRQLLKELHDNPTGGHQGQRRTLDILKLKYYWKNMKQDVNRYIETCTSCNERKTNPKDKLKAPMVVTNTPSKVFDTLHVDIVGPLTVTDNKNKYLLTFQDSFSKYPEAIPIPDQTAETIAKYFVKEIICKHGTPRTLISDQGSNFMSDLFKECCKLLKIEKLRTTAFHPQSNGQVERFHRNLIDYLSHYVNKEQSDWDEWVPFALLAYRATPQSTTGFSPFFMVHGREPELPSEIIFDSTPTQIDLSENDYVLEITTRLKEAFKVARQRIIKSKEQSKTRYDQNSVDKTFQPEDLVLLLDETVKRGRSRKLKKPWIGPYKVMKKLDHENYAIKKGRKSYIVHANRLKAFRHRTID